MKSILLAVFLTIMISLVASTSFCQQRYTEGTTLVVKKVGNELFVAADGKMIVRYFDSTNKPVVVEDNFCKIWSAGTFGFAVSGSNIDLAKKAAIELYQHSLDDPAAIIQEYYAWVKKSIGGHLQLLKNSDQSRFERLYNTLAKRPLRTLFFGIFDDRVWHLAVTYRFSVAGNSEVELEEIRDLADFKVLGIADHILNADADPATWKNGIAEGLEVLVSREIKEHPELLGTPISIIKITSKGSEWIKRDISCK